jgi:ribosomal protein S18 acetylase RimI-like enzyme
VNVAVRPLRPADRGFVDDLGRRTVASSVAAVRPAPETVVQQALAELLQGVQLREHTTLVAESDGARAGFLLLIEDLPDEVTLLPQAFVAYMAVEPAYRRHGVASALLAAAEDEARRRGLSYISLMVTQENAPARALYERAGYVTERRLMCKPL